MKKQVAAILLMSSCIAASPSLAQTKLTPKASSRVDNCAPIGRTANGELVYSMKCETLPAPPPPPQAEVKETPPPPEPEVHRSGLFGWSYDRRQPDQ
jgi:hypothetical protein